MSWLDRLQNVEVEIVTGDGTSYLPLWRNAKRSKNYNYTAFNFINVAGTRVDRRQPEGSQYDLEIYFQGEDHIDVAENFESSADDIRAWTIIHPFYDRISVQPLSIERDDKLYNRTLFRIKVWETIGNQYPVESTVPQDAISEARSETEDQLVDGFSAINSELDTHTKASITSTLAIIDSSISSELPTTGTTVADFKSKVGLVTNAITEPIAVSSSTLNLLIDVINFPIQEIQSVDTRISLFQDLLSSVKAILLPSDSSIELEDKKLYQILGTSLFASMLDSAMNPGDDDYTIRSEVAEVSQTLNDEYADLLQTLEGIQTDRPDEQDAFTADDITSRMLYETFVVTQANLFDQAFDARQERIIVLEKNDNAIRLTHRFYGLDADDENLDFFINTNDLHLNELINIDKGRLIRYYI